MELQNNGITELQNYGITEGHGKSNIAPLFQSGAIIKFWTYIYHHSKYEPNPSHGLENMGS